MADCRRLTLVAALALVVGGDAPAEAPAAVVEGRVVAGIEGLALAEVAPLVVYLEPVEGPSPRPPSREARVVRQREARFHPRFLAIAVGESVDMPNEDAIYHNVFSYSRPNDFDLGLYPAGESRTVTFRHPGVVKTYCSIHETMSGTIFVAPSPWFDVGSPAGRYALRDVPPGLYRLVVWSERLPPMVRTIRLSGGERRWLELQVGPSSGSGAAAAASE